jgi:hypothetical protein
MPKRKPRRTSIRPGRPPLPREERRAHRLALHLSPYEFSLLCQRADRVGLQPHVVARPFAIYGQVSAPPVPRTNYSAVGQLGRIANLLKQALRQVTSGRLAADLRPLIEQSLEIAASLRHELVTPRS